LSISQLDKDIAILSPALDKNTVPVVQSIHNAYHYYKLTGRAAGLVELALLLEDENHGWLPQIIKDPMSGITNRFWHLIKALEGIDGANYYVGKLNKFRKMRNMIHYSPGPTKEEIEEAFRLFLEFAEWYYLVYHDLAAIDDESHYKRQLHEGDMLNSRFKVLQYLGGDVHGQTYKVRDLESNERQAFAVKIPFITGALYSLIMKNEKKSRSLFNGHPNIGRIYSSFDLIPAGEAVLLEYFEARTLRTWLKETVLDDKGLSDFLYIIGRVLNALCYIHSKDYVHGAVSPDSILITPENHVKLVSFDYCSHVSSTVELNEKLMRKVTPYSPSDVGGRTKDLDTYALGKVIREAVNGLEVNEPLAVFIAKACGETSRRRYSDGSAMFSEWEKVYPTVHYRVCDKEKEPRKVALVSCTRRKKPYGCSARELYSESERFIDALAFVEAPGNGYDQTYIVSARYGLVDLEQQLAPYDCDLLEFPEEEQTCWAAYITQLLQWKDVGQDCKVVVHADDLYSKLLIKALTDKGITAEKGPF